MLPDPIHPVIVHFPIVLAVTLPIFFLAALWTIARGKPFRQAWASPVLLAGALALSAFVALKTGEAQEERVEPVVGEAPMHEHEEAAEAFLLLSGIVFVLAGGGLLGGRFGTGLRYAATAGTLALVVAVVRVGDSGGSLVYEHGAAQAYVQGASSHSERLLTEIREGEDGEERGEG